jgi:hypothetical protein
MTGNHKLVKHSSGFSAMMSGCLVMVLLCSASAVSAEVYSPIQSPARPFGLSIVDLVQVPGSDASSAEFQGTYLPVMEQWGNMDLTAASFTELTSTIALDPSMISLATAYDTRVYFIGDATSKHNALGFNTAGGGISGGDPLLIFPDASESLKIDKKTGLRVPTSKDPLVPGNFVDLGTLEEGSQLDFFLISQRTRTITDVFSTDTSINPDGLQHAMVFAVPDSPYLFIAFEDQFGGTANFRDNLFAVDIGAGNVRALTNMPEPSTMLVLGSFLALVLYRKKGLDPRSESRIT